MAKGSGVGGGRGGGPNPVDVHVGNQMRRRRTLLGLSQEKLGEAIGLTFQQIQKYERGANRISASRLYDLYMVLDVDANYFFENLSTEAAAQSPAHRFGGWSESDQENFEYERDPQAKREMLELSRAYYRIKNTALRKQLFEMTKALGAAFGGEDEPD